MKVVNIMQIVVTEYVTEILEDVPVKDSFCSELYILNTVNQIDFCILRNNIKS
jgi:hypothetical protein